MACVTGPSDFFTAGGGGKGEADGFFSFAARHVLAAQTPPMTGLTFPRAKRTVRSSAAGERPAPRRPGSAATAMSRPVESLWRLLIFGFLFQAFHLPCVF